ncbi:MAG: SIMPL domain-containing protein, partial [Anaerolineales bacterium]|nr:SIMPL domain-containing protein [Anaerolineales bacterium]
LLTAVTEAGATNVHGIDFRTSELRKYRDQARALAVQAASEKAEAMAGELSISVGTPKSINEDHVGWWSWYGYGWWGSRYAGMSQNVVQNASGPSSDFEGAFAPGQISVNARVTVTFELLQ